MDPTEVMRKKLYIDIVQENEKLKQENETLKRVVENKVNEYDDLLGKNQNLREEKSKLEEENAFLSERINALVEENEAFKNKLTQVPNNRGSPIRESREPRREPIREPREPREPIREPRFWSREPREPIREPRFWSREERREERREPMNTAMNRARQLSEMSEIPDVLPRRSRIPDNQIQQTIEMEKNLGIEEVIDDDRNVHNSSYNPRNNNNKLQRRFR